MYGKDEYYKLKYIEAANEAFNSGKLDIIKQNDGVYTFEMLSALKDMAENDVYPDWRFGDNECNVWEMFRTGAH